MGRFARMCTGNMSLRILNGQVCKDVNWIHMARILNGQVCKDVSWIHVAQDLK